MGTEKGQREATVKDFEFGCFDLEVNDKVYHLELNNLALKKSDELNLLNKITSGEIGVQVTVANLIYIFSLKTNPFFSTKEAQKIAETLFENGTIYDVASDLISEFTVAYNSVFQSKGAKKVLTKKA